MEFSEHRDEIWGWDYRALTSVLRTVVKRPILTSIWTLTLAVVGPTGPLRRCAVATCGKRYGSSACFQVLAYNLEEPAAGNLHNGVCEGGEFLEGHGEPKRARNRKRWKQPRGAYSQPRSPLLGSPSQRLLRDGSGEILASALRDPGT